MSRMIRGLTALVALASLLVSVPLGLAHFVGQPWPRPIPGFAVVWQSVRRGDISDPFVIKVLAILLWLAWARLAISVLVEMVAMVTGRAVPRIATLGSSQRSAAALVAAIMLLAGGFGRSATASASPVRSRPLPLSLLSADTVGARPAIKSVASHSVRVVPGDTLSSIAAEELGASSAWPELWTANRGREFADRTFNDPNLILPGWQLAVPDDFVSPAAVEDAPGAITGVPAIDPGLCVVPPPLAGQVSQIDGPRVDHRSGHSRAASLPVPVGLGGALLLASGVIGSLEIRRRRQLRSAPRHARLAQRSPDLAVVEIVLRRLDERELIARVDIALRAVASELCEAAPGVAVLAVLSFPDGGLEIILTAPVAQVPLPWLGVSPDRWRLPATVQLEALTERARRVNQPCPALAHLGSTVQSNGLQTAQLFVDLEALGLLAIDAARPQATDIARAIAAGVAVSPMSEVAHLITVGLGEVHLARPCTFSVASLDEAIDLAVGLLGSTVTATSTSVSTFALRAGGQGGEAWEPAIVVAALGCAAIEELATTDSELDSELVSLSAMGARGLAIVVDRAIGGARWRIEQCQREWLLQPLGLAIVPVGLTSDDVVHVHSLLVEADKPLLREDDELSVATKSLVFVPPTSAPVSGVDWIEPEWSMMVRLLGPVEVCDRAGQLAVFERSKALELVVWLSQHRDRSTRTSARTALWELNVRDATFANVVSDSRRALRRLVPGDDGTEWITRTLTEQLPLQQAVVTDAELLALRLDFARTQRPRDAIATLRPGLALVRDQVFFGTSYLWTDAEGMTTQLTLLVTSAASVLAGHYLSVGDTEGVFWATGQGLRVLAGHEELIALRMRAHALHGDLAGVRQEWESYERALMADTWSSGEPAPKLAALRRELLSLSLTAAPA